MEKRTDQGETRFDSGRGACVGYCYWCYWGWPKKIAEIYDGAVAALGGRTDPMEFGPAHIVWSDENWEAAQWCLDHFDEHRGYFSDSDLEIVKTSLIELLSIDEEMKVPPEGFDIDNPAASPPPEHWQCVRR